MNIALESPVTVGDTIIAALSSVSISSAHSTRHVSVACTKHPVAILFKRGKRIAIVDGNGALISKKELEKRYPGTIAKFKDAIG